MLNDTSCWHHVLGAIDKFDWRGNYYKFSSLNRFFSAIISKVSTWSFDPKHSRKTDSWTGLDSIVWNSSGQIPKPSHNLFARCSSHSSSHCQKSKKSTQFWATKAYPHTNYSGPTAQTQVNFRPVDSPQPQAQHPHQGSYHYQPQTRHYRHPLQFNQRREASSSFELWWTNWTFTFGLQGWSHIAHQRHPRESFEEKELTPGHVENEGKAGK